MTFSRCQSLRRRPILVAIALAVGSASLFSAAREPSRPSSGAEAQFLKANHEAITKIDLNSNATPGRAQSTTGGVFGGRQTVYTLGVNSYPVSNVRLMLDYVHAEVNKLSANSVTPAGVTLGAIAARTQVAF